jgi:hypothetical protein
VTHMLTMDEETFAEIEAILAQLRDEPGLSAAERNLVVYLDGLMRIRRWSEDLDGFVPHVRALAERRCHADNPASPSPSDGARPAAVQRCDGPRPEPARGATRRGALKERSRS